LRPRVSCAEADGAGGTRRWRRWRFENKHKPDGQTMNKTRRLIAALLLAAGLTAAVAYAADAPKADAQKAEAAPAPAAAPAAPPRYTDKGADTCIQCHTAD
jgi:mono/diheme cytochrome c family protein